MNNAGDAVEEVTCFFANGTVYPENIIGTSDVKGCVISAETPDCSVKIACIDKCLGLAMTEERYGVENAFECTKKTKHALGFLVQQDYRSCQVLPRPYTPTPSPRARLRHANKSGQPYTH